MADEPKSNVRQHVNLTVGGDVNASGSAVVGGDQSKGKSVSVVNRPDDGLSRKARQLIALAAGVAALATGVTMAAVWRDMSAPMYTFLRVVMALGAGAFAAFLDGFLKVRFGKWLRAGGGLAVFALVYFVRVAEPTSATPTTLPAAPGSNPVTATPNR